MKKIYLFSDFNNNFPKEIGKNLKNDINIDNFVFIPTIPGNTDISKKYFDLTKKLFKNIGIDFKNSILLDRRYSSNEAKNIIKNATTVFLSGGDTLNQFKFIKEYQLEKVLDEFNGVLMGLSAGAINLGETSMVFKDNLDSSNKVYDGFGISPITVIPHFEPTESDLNEKLTELSSDHLIFAITDNSAIKVTSTLEFFGDIYLLDRGRTLKLK
ncbi:Type 1 glutamine amidotransferase-like domain-containing protein [Fusobacteria bacterium ZRK30]|nr:Type 1 glutamine amidotransferase-like domain-containing protein [Fusobacteria bacterium ZRK30]